MHARWIPLAMGAMLVTFSWTPAYAGNCGKPECKPCAAAPCGQCGEEIQYEARQVTEYKTVYEEVKVPKVIETVKFVAETELREAPCSVCEAQPGPACGPAGCDACAPCQAAPCQKVCGMRKVPVTVYRAVPDKKTIETVQIVERKIPHTYTCYVPIPTPTCGCTSCGK
jgi:hypothetical protein